MDRVRFFWRQKVLLFQKKIIQQHSPRCMVPNLLFCLVTSFHVIRALMLTAWRGCWFLKAVCGEEVPLPSFLLPSFLLFLLFSSSCVKNYYSVNSYLFIHSFILSLKSLWRRSTIVLTLMIRMALEWGSYGLILLGTVARYVPHTYIRDDQRIF